MSTSEITAIVMSSRLDLAIAGWIHSKKQRSQSRKTEKSYRDTLYQFQAALRFKHLDLDRLSFEPQQEYHGMSERQIVTLTAQEFASWSTTSKEVKATTHNQRLSVLSSFYEYAILNDFLDYNPIKKVERSKVQQYKTSKALTSEQTASGLNAIDRTTQRGKRDYAILTVLFATGRRLSEVGGLQRQDIYVSRQNIVTLNFPDLKGNKEISDKLDEKTSKALLDWLHDYYGDLAAVPAEAPLWVALASGGRTGGSFGQALSARSFSDICQKYLDTGKVHRTRHTWTKNMLDAGASLPLIKKKLGHNSLATTGIYAEALESVDNPFAEEIARRTGIE